MYRNKLIEKFIKFFKDLDIAIILIKDLDEIMNDIDFLKCDLNYVEGYDQYKDVDIFTLQYPKDKIEIAIGKVKDILNNYEFKHDIDTDYGSSGSPIILPNTLKVIGIHKQSDTKYNINYGTFIGEILKNLLDNKENNDKDIKNKSKINIKSIPNISTNKNFNNISNKRNDITTNFIIGEIYISRNEINKDIRIINSFEKFSKFHNYSVEELQLALGNENEREIKDCIIEINDIKKSSFSYFHIFNDEGKYKIKYSFKYLLTNCSCIFADCSSLKNLDFSNFKTQKIKNMSGMFAGCSNLINLDFSNFNTQNVTNMGAMFRECDSLVNLDLSNFNTQNVVDVSEMFRECDSLVNLDLSNFHLQKDTRTHNMFGECDDITIITKDSKILEEYENRI